MTCPRCGRPTEATDRFCPGCGSMLAAPESTESTAATPPVPAPPAWSGASAALPPAPPPTSQWHPPVATTSAPVATNLGGLATALTWLFALIAVASALLAVFRFIEWSLLDDLRTDPLSVEFSDLEDSDDRINALTGVRTMLILATAVVFIVWLHAATKNLRAFGYRDLRYGPGWAIGGWFVPFANLVIPKQVVDDAWRGADPQAAPSGRPAGPVPGVFLAWWLAFLASTFLDRIGNFVGDADDADISQLQTASQLTLLAALAAALGAGLAIVVVSRMTARHRARSTALLGTYTT
ncbi:MAG TPA: DUF4328 domain-containing protein [Acidimicrobiia bacterium]|nr:DUF4328 domain-containing protein [Acidimicrobiia bacterium]